MYNLLVIKLFMQDFPLIHPLYGRDKDTDHLLEKEHVNGARDITFAVFIIQNLESSTLKYVPPRVTDLTTSSTKP